MAQKQKQTKEDVQMENVQEALSKSEAFIEKYRKQLTYGVGIVVVIVLAIILFQTYYLKPREVEAEEAMIEAVNAFERGEYEVALRGNEQFDGFEAVAAQYGITTAGESAALYAAACELQLGEYEEAIRYFKKVGIKSVNMTPAYQTAMGDCYVELGEYKDAAKCFEKAAKSENLLVAPRALKKAGLVYEKMGDNKKAAKAYKAIKADYPTSQEAQDIDKYIVRAEAE